MATDELPAPIMGTGDGHGPRLPFYLSFSGLQVLEQCEDTMVAIGLNIGAERSTLVGSDLVEWLT